MRVFSEILAEISPEISNCGDASDRLRENDLNSPFAISGDFLPRLALENNLKIRYKNGER